MKSAMSTREITFYLVARTASKVLTPLNDSSTRFFVSRSNSLKIDAAVFPVGTTFNDILSDISICAGIHTKQKDELSETSHVLWIYVT